MAKELNRFSIRRITKALQKQFEIGLLLEVSGSEKESKAKKTKIRFDSSAAQYYDLENNCIVHGVQGPIEVFHVESEEDYTAAMIFFHEHELQHLLSTAAKYWESGIKHSAERCAETLVTLAGYRKIFRNHDDCVRKFEEVYHVNYSKLEQFCGEIINIIEDGRIERIRALTHELFRRLRTRFRGILWMQEDTNPDYNTMSPIQVLCKMRNAVLIYATTGLCPKGFIKAYYGTEMYDNFKQLKSDIMAGVNSGSTKEMVVHAEDVIIKLMPLYKAVLDSEESDVQFDSALFNGNQPEGKANARDEEQDSGEACPVFNSANDEQQERTAAKALESQAGESQENADTDNNTGGKHNSKAAGTGNSKGRNKNKKKAKSSDNTTGDPESSSNDAGTGNSTDSNQEDGSENADKDNGKGRGKNKKKAKSDDQSNNADTDISDGEPQENADISNNTDGDPDDCSNNVDTDISDGEPQENADTSNNTSDTSGGNPDGSQENQENADTDSNTDGNQENADTDSNAAGDQEDGSNNVGTDNSKGKSKENADTSNNTSDTFGGSLGESQENADADNSKDSPESSSHNADTDNSENEPQESTDASNNTDGNQENADTDSNAAGNQEDSSHNADTDNSEGESPVDDCLNNADTDNIIDKTQNNPHGNGNCDLPFDEEQLLAEMLEAADSLREYGAFMSSDINNTNFEAAPEASDDSTPLTTITRDDIVKVGLPNFNLREYHRQYNLTESLPQDLQQRGRVLRQKNERYFKNMQTYNQTHLTSGKLDSARMTDIVYGQTDIFMKKGQDNKFDGCVYMLVDNSGSMAGNKRIEACRAAAVIEEGFKGLLPIKITAFDCEGDIIHEVVKNWDEKFNHNCCWNFALQGREGCGNSDWADIFTATKELCERHEQHKLLIVLSDGAPDNIQLTKNMIDRTRKLGIPVYGIYFNEGHISDVYSLQFKNMYQKDYVCCELSEIDKNLERLIINFSRR